MLLARRTFKLKALNGLFYRQLIKKRFTNDEQRHLYLIQMVSVVFAMLIHIISSIFFIIANQPSFVIYNLISVGVYVLCLFLVEKNYNMLSGLILSIEVIVYAFLVMFVFGVNNFIIMNFAVTLMMQLVVRYARTAVRVTMIFILWACMIVTGVFTFWDLLPPLIDLGQYAFWFSMINLHTGILGIIAELTVDSMVGQLISRFNQEQLEKFRSEANLDPLTDLFNRRYASIVLNQLQKGEMGQQWCVAMLDIDDFKIVNDNYGHEVGDRVLKALSIKLTETLRNTDYVFRWGGEEFLILLKDVDTTKAFRVLDKLRKAVAAMDVLLSDGSRLKVTVTMGIAKMVLADIDGSVRISDQKLYEGKNIGKNVVVV